MREDNWKVTGPGRNAAIADYESAAILEGEKVAGAWQPKSTKLTMNVHKMLQDHLMNTLVGTMWIRGDGNATATLDNVHLYMSFESLAAVQHDEEIKRSNEEKQWASVPAF